METDKRYFIEGLFIIGFTVAAALFAVWVVNTGQRDDVTYRIRFAESVSGLALGDPVKFHGVDVGSVTSIGIDPQDPRLVLVDVRLRKDTPVKTDTKASLKLKGITGVVYVELNGGNAAAKSLAAATPDGKIPEIPYEKSTLTNVLDQLPRVIEKFSALEDRAAKVVSDVSSVTGEIKEDPTVLLRGRKEKKSATSGEKTKPEPTGPRASPTGR
jgi:phospholipid/cholesterol/gamma-HCH transport system substrate-binding protein